MNDLEQFKQSLRDIIDTQSFAGTPEVFRKIEESAFAYNKSILATLRQKATDTLTQLSSGNFLVGVTHFIDAIREDSSKKDKDVVSSNDIQNELYKYYLAYPTTAQKQLIARFKAKDKCEKVNIFFVHGKSSPIKAVSQKSPDRKFLWFIEHLLPDYIGLAKTKHTLADFSDTKYLNKFGLLEHVALNLGVTGYDDIDEDNQNEVLQKLALLINKKLKDGFLVFPIFLHPKGQMDTITTFFTDFLAPLVEETKSLVTNHTLLFLLLCQQDNAGTVFQFGNYTEEIKIEGVDESKFGDWVDDARHSFFQKHEELCEEFTCDSASKTAVIPPCQTLEKLFENITQLIFPDVDFHQFLKNNVQNQLTK